MTIGILYREREQVSIAFRISTVTIRETIFRLRYPLQILGQCTHKLQSENKFLTKNNTKRVELNGYEYEIDDKAIVDL